jgi:pimeloyl-ACP methyl ester carboxylesterase
MKDLLLLHGAIGSEKQFEGLREKLKDTFNIHTLSFSGHGGGNLPGIPFSMDLFAADVIRFLKTKGIEKIDIFGYSMGGYVALYLARNNPEMVNRIFTLATKFDWTPESAMRESQLLDPVRIEENLPAFARLLKERHSVALWQSVLDLTVKMMMEMGSNPPLLPDDLGKIESRTLIGVGDRDRMFTGSSKDHSCPFSPLPLILLRRWTRKDLPVR